MASTGSGDLAHRKAEAGQAARVVIGLYIAGDDSHARLRREALQSPLEQGCLAGAGRADAVQHQRAAPGELLAQRLRDAVVFAQHLSLDGDSLHFSPPVPGRRYPARSLAGESRCRERAAPAPCPSPELPGKTAVIPRPRLPTPRAATPLCWRARPDGA